MRDPTEIFPAIVRILTKRVYHKGFDGHIAMLANNWQTLLCMNRATLYYYVTSPLDQPSSNRIARNLDEEKNILLLLTDEAIELVDTDIKLGDIRFGNGIFSSSSVKQYFSQSQADKS